MVADCLELRKTGIPEASRDASDSNRTGRGTDVNGFLRKAWMFMNRFQAWEIQIFPPW